MNIALKMMRTLMNYKGFSEFLSKGQCWMNIENPVSIQDKIYNQ